jgi:hypothetical protein
MRVPPVTTRAPLASGVGDVRLHLGHGLLVDQRALVHAGLEAVADLDVAAGGQLLDEGVVDASCTYRRLAQTQVWPALRYLLTIAPSTALSMSASSNTMKGALPPSSRLSFLMVGAHCAPGCGRPRWSR